MLTTTAAAIVVGILVVAGVLLFAVSAMEDAGCFRKKAAKSRKWKF